MFQVSDEEFKNLIFQNGTSSWGGTRKPPYAFTEQGVAMLSGVLSSDTAIEVNIRIIRIFTKLRELLLTHKDILLKLEQLERQVVQNSEDIQIIFAALKELLNPPQEPPRPRIGFRRADEEKDPTLIRAGSFRRLLIDPKSFPPLRHRPGARHRLRPILAGYE